MLSKDGLVSVVEQERYKKRIQKLSSETLHLILKDPSKAYEYARKNVDKSVATHLKSEYIEMMVNGMRILAQAILKERDKHVSKT